jgi:predicted choloylglycine hydrolase
MPNRVSASAHPIALDALTVHELTDLLERVCGELDRRAQHDVVPTGALDRWGHSMAVIGRSMGAGYARAWIPTTAPGRRPRTCTLAPSSRAPVAPEPLQEAAAPELTHRMTMYGIREERPGPRWQALFRATWAAYRAWYLSEGREQRTGLAASGQALSRHMPELVPTWERLVRLTDGDELAARMLTLWNPPAFAPGCSQLVTRTPSRALVRNYDYDPNLFEGVVYSSRFSRRRVLGTGDCLWGLLDGMNDDGLAVSLAYGGLPGTGKGFAIPLVVRYLLEVCATVGDARAVLEQLPVAAAYNLTLSDRSGVAVTAFVAPGRRPEYFDAGLATNHRGLVPDEPQRARLLGSVVRQDALRTLDRASADPDDVAAAFLEPPLFNTAYSKGFGTLYTAVYRPDDGTVDYIWPGTSWTRSFDSAEQTLDVVLREPLRP